MSGAYIPQTGSPMRLPPSARRAIRMTPADARDPVCPSCKGKGVDRHGFDCVPCLGSGEVDE